MIIRAIIYGALFFIAIKLFKSIFAPIKKKHEIKERGTEELMKDPSCGTYIPQKNAIEKKIKGERYFFCSEKCYKEFKERN